MKGYFEKMKKFVLAFGIPVLAVASLIGSGYATWYFNSGIVTGEKGITVEPTEKKVVGAVFEHSEDASLASLVLDQPDDTTDGMPHDRQNVHFDGTFKEFLKAFEGDDDPSDDKFVDGTFYKVTTTITVPSAVAKYVNFTFNGLTSSADSTADSTLKKEVSKLEVKSSTPKYEVFDISEVTVAYTTNKPKNSNEYEIMKKAVKGQSITIDFTAEIVTTTK